MQGVTLDIRKMTRGAPPRVPFKEMAQELLPERFQLSLVLCGDTLSRRINRTYRPPAGASKKKYAPNVLSFPLGEYEGEIFLNVQKAGKEAREFGISTRDRVAHLFVHGCLHLLGVKHGIHMERREKQTLKKFGFSQ